LLELAPVVVPFPKIVSVGMGGDIVLVLLALMGAAVAFKARVVALFKLALVTFDAVVAGAGDVPDAEILGPKAETLALLLPKVAIGPPGKV